MDKAAIIKLHNSGCSKRRIAKELGISRNTVDKYLDSYLKTYQKVSSCTDPIEISKLQDQLLSPDKMDTSHRKKLKFTGELEKRFYELIAINEERNKKTRPQ